MRTLEGLPSPGDAAQQLDPLLFPPKCVLKAPVPLPAQAGWAGLALWVVLGLRSLVPSPALMPNGTCKPPELELGCAPVPTQGGVATGRRDPMSFRRKASLYSTFPSFYGVVLFMAREGNEQPVRG